MLWSREDFDALELSIRNLYFQELIFELGIYGLSTKGSYEELVHRLFRFKVLILDPLMRTPWNNETHLDLCGPHYSRKHVLEHFFRTVPLMIFKKFDYVEKILLVIMIV